MESIIVTHATKVAMLVSVNLSSSKSGAKCVGSQDCSHNPEVVGSNPAPATKIPAALLNARPFFIV